MKINKCVILFVMGISTNAMSEPVCVSCELGDNVEVLDDAAYSENSDNVENDNSAVVLDRITQKVAEELLKKLITKSIEKKKL